MIRPSEYVEISHVVRRPYIASRVDRYVSEVLKRAVAERVQQVTGLGAGWMPLRVVSRHVHHLMAGRRRHPNIVVAIDVETPGSRQDPTAGKAGRNRLRAVGPNHTDDARGFHGS